MTYLTNIVVLRKENYQDYDIKYILYSLEYGKISAVAKGAKKITSKLNPHLEFFMLSKVMIANGRFLKRIAGAQIIRHFNKIISNIEKRVIALYFFEIIDLLIKYDFQDIEVYNILLNFLDELSQGGDDREKNILCLNKYLYNLLSHLGYQPKLKAKTQRNLLVELNKAVSEISDQKVNSYDIISKIFF